MKMKLLVVLFAALAVLTNGAIAEDKKADAPKTAEKKEEKKEDKGKKKSDGEVLKENSAALIEAFKAKDVEKVMSHFSEKFASSKLQDKAALRSLLDMANNSGFLDGMTLDDKEMKITVDGDKATVAPVAVSGGFGSGTASFTCGKADGKWSITSMELDGIEF